MKTWSALALALALLAGVIILLRQMEGEEQYLLMEIPNKVEVKDNTLRQTKIPKRLVRSFATNKVSALFANAVQSAFTLCPDYEHIFFTDEDCDAFMKAEYAGEVYDAYRTLVPGAFKGDLWRICYLYKYGGVYLDLNKTLMMPLSRVINGNYDLVTTIDRPSCYVWQGFFACIAGLPVVRMCINKIVDNVKKRYYGWDCLDITGPMMMGKIFKEYYGECVNRPGVYRKRGELIKLMINNGEYNLDEFGYPVVDLNTDLRRRMDRSWKAQTSKPHYYQLWLLRQVYDEKALDKPEKEPAKSE